MTSISYLFKRVVGGFVLIWDFSLTWFSASFFALALSLALSFFSFLASSLFLPLPSLCAIFGDVVYIPSLLVPL
jgi:hypothetical protein